MKKLWIILFGTFLIMACSTQSKQKDEEKNIEEEPSKTYFTVTFDSSGGSLIDSQQIEKGKTATKPADPTKDGYKFSGWYSGTNIFDFSIPINSNITLKAKWEIKEETGSLQFTFDISDSRMKFVKIGLYDRNTENEITGFSEERWRIVSSSVVYSKNAVPVGSYRLKAFFYADNTCNLCIASINELITIVNDNKTVVEREISSDSDIYTITYELNGGEWEKDFIPTTQFTKYSNDIVLPSEENISKLSYYFAGWYISESNSDETITILSEKNQSITLYAKWLADCRVFASNLSKIDFSSSVFEENRFIKLCGEWTNADFSSLLEKIQQQITYLYTLDMSEATGITEIPSNAFYKSWKLSQIILPKTITSIGMFAFYECKMLGGPIVIPENCTSIGTSAFRYCSNLREVHILSKLKTLGGHTFAGCTFLTTVTIDNGIITKIPDNMFDQCSHLSNLTIPDTVVEIGFESFHGCSLLTDFSIFKNISCIGRRSFFGCGFSEINIPDTITELPEYSFAGNYLLTKITIPSTIKSIGERVFQGNSQLKEIILPSSITTIEEGAFQSSGLESITFSNSVKKIGATVFYKTNLKNVYFNGTLEDWLSIQLAGSWGGMNGANLYLNGIQLTEVIIPDTITKIPTAAFYGCSSITSVVIPNSVKTIETYTFGNCENLSEVYFNGTIEDWLSISFSNEKSNPCNNGAKLYLNNEEFTTLNIPSSVTNIQDYAFCGCKSLKWVYLHASITSIGKMAFYNCSNITSISISTDSWDKIDKGEDWATNIKTDSVTINGRKIRF